MSGADPSVFPTLPSAALDGRIAVVTGAAGGIGRAIVAALLQAGASVHGLDRDDQALQAMAWTAGERFVPHAVDLADRAALDGVLQRLIERLGGRLDILVNNAGISRVQPFADTDDALLDALMAVNLIAPLRLTRGLLGALAASPHAAIVNIASELALVGQTGYAAYTATKGGILAWTRALAVELAPQRIRANAVCPGPIHTAMLQAEFDVAADPLAAQAAEVAAIPVGRLGRPGDIAAVVAFLASDAADFVNGAVWAADGGKTAQ